jgi:hypothetical protein
MAEKQEALQRYEIDNWSFFCCCRLAKLPNPNFLLMSRSSSIVGTTTQTHQNNPDENNEF